MVSLFDTVIEKNKKFNSNVIYKVWNQFFVSRLYFTFSSLQLQVVSSFSLLLSGLSAVISMLRCCGLCFSTSLKTSKMTSKMAI